MKKKINAVFAPGCKEVYKIRQDGKGDKKMKKRFAFSLIELLISLIVTSVIIAAFTPVITTKLKHRELALAGSKIGKKCSEKFGENCVYCSETECSLCLNFLSCAGNQYIDVADNCTCKNCPFANCASCTKDYCKSCIEGYEYNPSTHQCTPCYAPNYSPGGTSPCKPCNSGYQYQDDNKQGSCKYCDSANGWFPNGDRKGCSQKTCDQAQRRDGTDCKPCNGVKEYQPSSAYSGTSCYICGDNQVANGAHTGCDCAPGYTWVGASCISTNCPNGYWNGSGCTYCGTNQHVNSSSNGCECDTGYEPNGSGGCKAIVVAPPDEPDIECPEHCVECSSTTSCVKCEEGYEWKDGACKKKIPCNLDMVFAGTHMVTRFNLGDDPKCKWDELSKLDSEIIFIQTGKGKACDSESKKCCWYGKTANPCGDASGGIYGGCNRTVCNHAAAQALCKAVNMSLPTVTQMSGWNNYSTKNTGLMLCHTNQSGNTNLSNCNFAESCKNTGNGNCLPGWVWSSSSTSAYRTEGAWNESDKTTKKWTLETTLAKRALSVRCVL